MKTPTAYLVIENCALALDEDNLLSVAPVVSNLGLDQKRVAFVDWDNLIAVTDVLDWDQSPWEATEGPTQEQFVRYSELLVAVDPSRV